MCLYSAWWRSEDSLTPQKGLLHHDFSVITVKDIHRDLFRSSDGMIYLHIPKHLSIPEQINIDVVKKCYWYAVSRYAIRIIYIYDRVLSNSPKSLPTSNAHNVTVPRGMSYIPPRTVTGWQRKLKIPISTSFLIVLLSKLFGIYILLTHTFLDILEISMKTLQTEDK